jgi:hypothetical protein
VASAKSIGVSQQRSVQNIAHELGQCHIRILGTARNCASCSLSRRIVSIRPMSDSLGYASYTVYAAGIENRRPSEGLQFFGVVRVAAATREMTVSLHDQAGERLFSVDLMPRS